VLLSLAADPNIRGQQLRNAVTAMLRANSVAIFNLETFCSSLFSSLTEFASEQDMMNPAIVGQWVVNTADVAAFATIAHSHLALSVPNAERDELPRISGRLSRIQVCCSQI